MSRVRYGSKDLFSLGPSFTPQSTSETHAITYAEKRNALGEESCAQEKDNMVTAQASYTYEGSDLINELKSSLVLGGLKEEFLITAISINFSNTSTIKVSVTGHKHLTGNGHNDGSSVLSNYEVDLALAVLTVPSCMGVPIDGSFENTNPDSNVRSMTVNFTCKHNDIPSNLGVHKCGHNFDGRIAVSVNYIGVPDVVLPEGWHLTSQPFNTNNQSFEITEISAYKSLDRIAV